MGEPQANVQFNMIRANYLFILDVFAKDFLDNDVCVR